MCTQAWIITAVGSLAVKPTDHGPSSHKHQAPQVCVAARKHDLRWLRLSASAEALWEAKIANEVAPLASEPPASRCLSIIVHSVVRTTMWGGSFSFYSSGLVSQGGVRGVVSTGPRVGVCSSLAREVEQPVSKAAGHKTVGSSRAHPGVDVGLRTTGCGRSVGPTWQ
ncbi:hypothetical protein B0T17DRAFT_507097 [Bombardia bombarda]|uniref:Uncharacterized protein n=1 Tax=Bombardia bombarda TaxID=252184 RepID=A0AA39XB24_9PEZI|nr:hypothetical protein B0T17DRAFT_507097 [Bombardia bombarda]